MTGLSATLAAAQSPLVRLDPKAKLCGVFFTVLVISTFPAARNWKLIVLVLILTGLFLLFRVPLWYLLKRCLAATPFIAMAVIVPLASGIPDAVDVSTAIALKAYSAVLLLILLAATTPMEDIIQALRQLGIPRGLALTAVLMFRYLFVLLEEWQRISRARACRSGNHHHVGRTRILANQVSMVFLRGWERSERVAQALLVRGFKGDFPRLKRSRSGKWDFALSLLLPLALLVLRVG